MLRTVKAGQAWGRWTAALYFACCIAGAETFSVRQHLYQVGPNPTAIVAHDLNGDGLPEIVTADRGVLSDLREERPANDEVSVLFAKGNLEYERFHPSLKTDFAPYALAVANVDTLKWPDIIVGSFLATKHNDIMVFLNRQQENLFQPVEFRFPDENLMNFRQADGDGNGIFTKPGITSLVVQDITHDGLRDLVATGWSSDVIVFMPGDATAYFGPPKFTSAPGGPRDVQLADFDHDNQSDLAVAMYSSGEATLWKGDGAGNFTEAARFPTRGHQPCKIRVSDINRDGTLDLIVAHAYTEDSIVIFYGDGNFSFTVSQEILLGENRQVLEQEIRDIVVDDFNGDGRPDIAAACYASGKVMVLLNEGGEPVRFHRESYGFDQGKPRALCSADFDQNGTPDLAVALWDNDSVGLLMNETKVTPVKASGAPEAPASKTRNGNDSKDGSRSGRRGKSGG